MKTLRDYLSEATDPNWPEHEAIIEYARQHGIDSEPDHEVGDLQDAVRVLCDLATPDQLHAAIEQLSLDWDGD